MTAKAFFVRPILVVVSLMVSYVSLIILCANRFGLWSIQDGDLAKATIVWFFGTAAAMWLNYADANKPHFFKKASLRTLRFAVAIEFLLNLYVFNIWVELGLVPLATILGGMQALANAKPEFSQVRGTLAAVLAVIGLGMIARAAFGLITDPGSMIAINNVELFLLPLSLTLLFLPFIYVLALYSAYEMIFLRIDLSHLEAGLTSLARRQALWLCKLDLSCANKLLESGLLHLGAAKSEAEVRALLSTDSTMVAGR